MKQETNKAAGPEAGGTSGQSVHKSKFRQKSKQEQAAASKLRMEQRGEKLEKAKDKLAKQKPPKKPGPVKRVGRTAGRGVHGFVHGKLFEVEQENVGTEGAHRSELVGESALRHGSRFIKRKCGSTRQRLSTRRSPNISRQRRIIIPHGRPGAPGNVRQFRFPDVAQAPPKKQYQKRRGRLQRPGRQARPKRQPPPQKKPGQKSQAL